MSSLASAGTPVIRDEPVVDRFLTDDELRLRSALREVIARDVAPGAAQRWADHEFADSSFQALAAAGMAGLIFPREYGGSDASTVAYAVAVEEITEACPSTSLVYMTQMHGAYPILAGGTEAQCRELIPSLCSGASYGALAITEPAAGSDVSSLRTTATRDGDDYVLNGSKTFITNGDRADTIVCFATLGRDAGRGGVTAFVVHGDTPGLTRGAPFHKLGMHASGTAELFLDNVRIPESARIGEEGGAWQLSMRTVVKSRISAASQGVGIARAVHALAVSWAAGRQLLRDPAWQNAAFELAELRAEIAQARLLLYSVARASDEPHDRDLTADVGMAKMICTDLGVHAGEVVTRLLGEDGDLDEVGVARFLLDAKVTQIYDGTNEIQRLLITRDTTRAAEAARDLARH